MEFAFDTTRATRVFRFVHCACSISRSFRDIEQGPSRSGRVALLFRLAGVSVFSVALVVGFGLESLCADPAGTHGPAPANPVVYNISPQPLSSALEAFAAASGVQVLYDRPAGGEPRSPGVVGSMTKQAALQLLLRGTGLAARFDNSNDIVLGPISADVSATETSGPPPIGVPMLALDTLEVGSISQQSDTLDQQIYVGLIRSTIRLALQSDRRTSSGDYAVTLRLWIAPSGQILRTSLSLPSGDTDRDAAILSILQRVTISGQAPPGMAQPVVVGIHSRSAG
jgi:hypothetical protein